MANKRKYYRAIVCRIPPYSAINGKYYYEEDMYAYSSDGAQKSFDNYHKNGYGTNYMVKLTEISKENFRGHHKYENLSNEEAKKYL